MPVIFEKQIDSAKKLAVWQITESQAELFDAADYTAHHQFNEKRNTEKAVSRLILNYLAGSNAHKNLENDNFGKPYMKGSGLSLSFSHSRDMVACMVDLSGQPIGIDIEIIRERIQLMASKFCTETDVSELNGHMHHHLVWGGKEVLYKIYAKKELDFKAHLSVSFVKGYGKGNIHTPAHQSSHFLFYEKIDEYMLVWGY